MCTEKNFDVSTVIKELMHEFGFSNVKEFSNELGCNYMMLYYHYIGRNNDMSSELAKKIIARYPNVRTEFLMRGELPIFKGQEKEMPESFSLKDEVTVSDMFKLLERVTTLLEKVQAREEIIDEKIKRLEELEKSLKSSADKK